MKKPTKTKKQAHSFLNALYPQIPKVTHKQLEEYWRYRDQARFLKGFMSQSFDEATLKNINTKTGDKK